MRVVAEFAIEKLFDVIRCFSKDGMPLVGIPMDSQPASVYHTACRHGFYSVWKTRMTLNGNTAYDGNFFYCPHCGQVFHTGNANAGIHNVSIRDAQYHRPIPFSIQLRVVEYQHYLDIRVYALCVKTDKSMMLFDSCNVKERIRFNFLNRKITMKKDGVESEILPFRVLVDGRMQGFPLYDSVLSYFTPNCNVWGETRKKLDRVMVKVESCFREKLEKHFYGQHLHSVHVPTNAQLGAMLGKPLCNMAWRLWAPDAPNLKDVDYTQVLGDADGTPLIQAAEEAAKRKTGYLEMIRSHMGIPNWKTLNPIIMHSSIRSVIHLAPWIRIFNIPEYAAKFLTMWNGMTPREQGALECARLFIFGMARRKGQKFTLAMIAHSKDIQEIPDCLRMYRYLNADSKAVFWNMKLRARDVHNTLSSLVWKQRNANVVFPYREDQKRLSASLNGFQYMIPKDSHTLANWGHEFRNCVASYRERVLNGTRTIVACFCNDRPKVCIEIDCMRIVQAKMPDNVPVRTDALINRMVITYANLMGLIIDTPDVITCLSEETEVKAI